MLTFFNNEKKKQTKRQRMMSIHHKLIIYLLDSTDRDGARKFYGRGPANKNFWFSRIFLLKKIIFVVF
jgi:hypothetical protein